jgi:RNA polymerase sigma-70 factor (ECF subfamily)
MAHDNGSSTGTTLEVLLRDPTRPEAWPTFVARYGRRIYGWCRKWGLQNADAENVTQDIFLKLTRRLHTFTYDRSRGGFRAWLKTVARHAWADYRDGQRCGAVGAGGDAVQESLHGVAARDDLLRELEEAFDQDLLAEAMERVRLRVSARDWQVFTRLALEGRPGVEVAAELGMKTATAFVVRGRVQQKLCAEVRQLEGGGPAGEEST